MKKRVFGFMALLLLVGISSRYVAGTYAKYTAQIKRTGTKTVAKWDFAQDNESTSLTINLAETYDASTLVNGKIAPGTEGDFAVNVVNTDSEVGVDFTVYLDSITSKPTNLKFYKTRTGTAGNYTYSNELVPGNASTGKIEGYLTPNDSTGVDAHIYWKWEYETGGALGADGITTAGDANDNTDGAAAATLTIGVKINGIQTAPSATSKGVSRIK